LESVPAPDAIPSCCDDDVDLSVDFVVIAEFFFSLCLIYFKFGACINGPRSTTNVLCASSSSLNISHRNRVVDQKPPEKYRNHFSSCRDTIQ
jgi:hypothetical protein